MINIKNFDSNLLKIDKKDIERHQYLLHWIHHNKHVGGYEGIGSINPLYLIIGEVDGYKEESNRNKYLIFASTDKNQ